MKRKDKKGSWIVRCECVILKDVYCENCTEEEARSDPFEYAVIEEERDQMDWKVRTVEASE